MARYKVAPTKTSLLRIKKEEEFAEEGHALLEQKREILVEELVSVMDLASDAQKKVDQALAKAYYALEAATIKMGRTQVESASLAVNLSADISTEKRAVMGVDVPVIGVTFQDNPPYYSLKDTSFWLDETVECFKDVLRLLGKAAELKITVLRIAREVSKTARRVNALEKISLPDYQETIKYIAGVLEEQERQGFFVLKLIKSRFKKKTKSGGARSA